MEEKQSFLINMEGQYPTAAWIARILSALETNELVTIKGCARSEYPGHFVAHFGNQLRDGSI